MDYNDILSLIKMEMRTVVGFLLIFTTTATTVPASPQIESYGVPENRINNILDLNQSYFEGVNRIEFIWSNPDYRSTDGFYYPYSNKIIIYVYEWSDSYYRSILKHELLHHYCWYVKKEINLDHRGCFLNSSKTMK